MILLVCTILVLFAGCHTATDLPDDRFVTIVVESSSDYTCSESVIHAQKNSDVSINLSIDADDSFSDIDYPDYLFTQRTIGDKKRVAITLRTVRYSLIVTPKIKHNDWNSELADQDGVVTYYANDGTTKAQYERISQAHLRFNTLTAMNLFQRDGYVQIGWNTQPDGSGTHIGFGSRCDRENRVALYAEWIKSSDETLFEYTAENGKATITKYNGHEAILVIPRTLGGNLVTEIAPNAVTGASFDKIVLPDTMKRIKSKAFTNVKTNDLTLFDNLSSIAHDSFADCSFVSFHINAARFPGYSGTYFDVFSDKCDRLISIADQKKLVLVAGSSTRFGFDSNLLSSAFPDYEVANMGVFAYANMLPEYLIILSYLQEGDIMLSTPEFDTIETQFCTTTDISYIIFAMVEGNYDLFARIDCNLLTNVIPAFSQHIATPYLYRSYEITAYDYDEDFVPCDTPSYNIYGDYILPRHNNDELKLFGERRAFFHKRYFPMEYINSLNAVYKMFTDKGVTVLFEYSPRSQSSITEDSNSATITELGSYLKERINVPIIGTIEECLMWEYYFFGTDNHLSDDGVQIYTRRVIRDIKQYFENRGS